MRKSVTETAKRMMRVTHAWETSCPEQTFGEMTLDQFKQAFQQCRDADAKFAAVGAQWDTTRRERISAYHKFASLMQLVVNSVKGHPKYGADSALYAAMGYVPKSERNSGLTRRRERDEEKEIEKVS